MNSRTKLIVVSIASLTAALLIASVALANGGPFLIKYPNGDPAARGVPARLDPSLKPTREERLRVVKEDLTITFVVDPESVRRATAAPARPTPKPAPRQEQSKAPAPGQAAANAPATTVRPITSEPNESSSNTPPLAVVTAAYTIENPTAEAVEIDFGFPILRGIYIRPFSMTESSNVNVRLDNEYVSSEIISNSHIYGIIRQQARDVIEKAVASDAELARLVATARATGMVRERARQTLRQAVTNDNALSEAVAKDRQLGPLVASLTEKTDGEHEAARTALADYLTRKMKWDRADVALMVEFASLDFGNPRSDPRDRGHYWGSRNELVPANLGPLSAIGEQKTTQFFARVASRFDPSVAAAYEDIFSAWGGDVRERSLDLRSGQIRPREITVSREQIEARPTYGRYDAIVSDPTIYARVDYLDPRASLSEREKASCETVLKNLPVVFTFAPMNLVYYKVKFPANSTRTLTVSYQQFAYADTGEPGSYQFAYVLHPASMWKDFGPINLEIATPETVPIRASVACPQTGVEDRKPPVGLPRYGPDQSDRVAVYRGTVQEKTGELFVAIDSNTWSRVLNEKTRKPNTDRQASR